uniref:Uncharacterized protein n=1 Tax=Myoviridae sp. ctPoO4 TaxID=2827685 RepID=A0A8S5SML0_9CAUD|nr:MAG TPA: hypothetical protein [Myoviridae sp. ctPoO4]
MDNMARKRINRCALLICRAYQNKVYFFSV